MDAAGAEKIEYFIIFIIFQHRRLPRREAFGATFLESFERVTLRHVIQTRTVAIAKKFLRR